VAIKSNKGARQRVNSPIQKGSQQESESMANMMLPDDGEGEVITQFEKEGTKCKRVANMSNKSARGRVDSTMQEASKGVRESVANTMLPDD